MKITESKLRKMIRGVIREFTSTATAAGAQKGGYESADTRAKESDYNTKSNTYTTKLAAVDSSKKYRKPGRKKGTYDYSSTGGFGWGINPDWTTQTSEKDSAKTAKDSAKTDWDSAKEADLQAEVPTQEPPTGGAAAYGTGKAAGKGKGKDKKKKN